jgi:hypothetical protein
MSYNQPDRTAPRYRKSTLGILDWRFYNNFRKKYPQYKDLSNKELSTIISVFNEQSWDVAVNTRDGIELPEGMGYIFVGTCPSPKKLNIDAKKSYETGVIIRYRNFDSDNYLAKICYTNYASKYKFQHREIWKFTAARQFKQAVAKAYTINWRMYLQIDNFARISRAFAKQKIKDYVKAHGSNVPDNYNEFALE